MVKVLIVDDAYFVRLKLRHIIEPYQAEILEAENGLEAIKLYQQDKPDIVFLDVIMPELDGLSTLKRLKEIDNEVKVVMITSVGDQQTLLSALESGALHFLIKPFEEDKVIELLQNTLGTSFVRS